MTGKDQRRLAVPPELGKQLMGALLNLDAAVLGTRRIVFPNMVEMGEFGADPAEIVPDPGQNRLDLFGRFFRKCGGQIGTGDPLLAQQRANAPGDTAEQVCRLDRVEIAGGPQHADRQRPYRRFAERLGGLADTCLGANQRGSHQKPILVLRNAGPLSARENAWACVSPTGKIISGAGLGNAMSVKSARASESTKHSGRRSRTNSTSRR